MTAAQDALLEAVDASQPAALDFARDLVAIPTENPPGNAYKQCAEAIARKLKNMGLEPEIVEAPTAGSDAPGSCVVAFHGEGERVLYFHGHYDVVPRSREGQFEPVIEGAKLFGRGSSDMKGGLAAMVGAVEAVRRLGTRLNGRIGLVCVADEETGGARGSSWLARNGLLGKNAIGMLTPEPTSGSVWNANRGAISLRVTVKGKSAHVGLSCQGVNAFEGMLAMANEFAKLKTEIAGRETAYRVEPAEARRSILLLGGECRGGSNFNLVPDTCSFTLDRRINPEEDFAEEKRRLFEVLEKLGRVGIEHDVEILQEGIASASSEEHPLARTLSWAIESVTGSRPRFEMCPGLLETRFYAGRGIPAFAYGPGLLEVSHGCDEFVPLANISNCAAIYALVAHRVLAE
jgi:acetylornithine deacetylase/succinyl-diaminopimelate desuccinylase family protein